MLQSSKWIAVAAIIVVAGTLSAANAAAAPDSGMLTRQPLIADCGPPCAPKPPCECYSCECRKPADPKCPPKYNNLRFLENWKPCMCVPLCDRPDWTDHLKARHFGTPWFRLDVGGQARFRYESFVNAGFVEDNNDSWLLARFRLHTDMHFFNHFRVFVEGIYADQWTRAAGPRGIDVNQGDLLNAFAEVHGDLGGWQVGLAAGRRELQLGSQRLISPLDWANTRRTFQGGYGWAKHGAHKIDAFWTQPVVVDKYAFDEWNEDIQFWGAFYQNTTWTCLTCDVYFLGLDREAGQYALYGGEEMRYTVGARFKGEIAGTRLDYDVEGGYQFGDLADQDISAYFATAYVGWRPCGCPWDPKIMLGVDWASGDSRGDDSHGTFNQLYPLGHAYLGFMDLIGRQNVISPHLTVTAKPLDKLTIRLDWIGFWRDSTEDAVYNVGGGILRGPGSDESFTGHEIDLTLKYQVDRHWRITAGWAHFFAGEFIEQTGPSEDIDFVWTEVQWTF